MKIVDHQDCALSIALQQDLSSAEALNQAFLAASKKMNATSSNPLVATFFAAKLGPMLAIATEDVLLLLEFYDRKALLNEIHRLRRRTKQVIVPGETPPITQIKDEIRRYFEKSLTEFETPVVQYGSPFQLLAWDALKKIPYGQTRSYQEQALTVGRPLAHRAIANANGCNQLAIVYPCHRIVKSDGSLGGYGGKIPRKKWLLEFEKGIVSDWVTAER